MPGRPRLFALATSFVLVPFLLGAAWDQTTWSPAVDALVADAVRAHADDVKAGGPPPVVVFDFDNTLIFGDISFVTVAFLIAEGRFGFDPAGRDVPYDAGVAARFAKLAVASAAERPALVDALTRDLLGRYAALTKESGKEEALRYLVHLLRGLTPEQARQLARDAFALAEKKPLCRRTLTPPVGAQGEPVHHQPGLRVRPALRQLMARLRVAGFEVWIVSASPERLVEGAAEAFGVPPERVVGVLSEEPDGRIGRTIVPPITWRAGKRAAIEKYIGRRPALVIGDAWTDFEMLVWAERGVLVDTSHDAALREALTENGVIVQDAFGSKRDLADCE